MNWGYKIILVYAIFVAGILFLVFKSSSQNQDLVSQDYYEQELKFQQRIDATERANKLSAQVKFEIRTNEVLLFFPEEMKGFKLKAHILLYCASDKNKDIQKDLSTTDALIHLAVPVSNKGSYELKINWTANNINYYFQHKLFIQ